MRTVPTEKQQLLSCRIEEALGDCVHTCTDDVKLFSHRSVRNEALIDTVTCPCQSNGQFIDKMQFFEEICNPKGVPKVELSQTPNGKTAVIAAGDQLVVIVRVDAETVDPLHVMRQCP